MIVANYMTRNPITIAPNTGVGEALSIMRQKNVRHLPVVENGKVLGIITDKDINGCLDPTLLSDLTMADIMTRNPVVIQENTTIQDAARLIFNKKTTGLLIIKNGQLTGIVTLADMLKVLVEILDVLVKTTRLNLNLKDRECLDNACQVIHDQGGTIVSIALVPGSEDVYSIRLEGGDVEAMVAAMDALDYKVELG